MPQGPPPSTETGYIRDILRQLRQLRQSILGLLIERVNTVTASGSAQTLPDSNRATMHHITLTANCALTFPTPLAGKSFTLKLIQDGTGSRAVTWPTSVCRFDSGTAPTLSTAAGSIDTFSCVCDDGTKFDVYFAGKGMA